MPTLLIPIEGIEQPPSPPPPPPPPNASIQFTSASIVPNLIAQTQTETINVHVSGTGGGGVAFTLNGQTVTASVDGNGNASASLTLTLATAGFPQSIIASYNGPSGASATAAEVANWTGFNTLLPSVDTFAPDGSQKVQTSLLGFPALQFLYSSQGRLTEVVQGNGAATWNYTYTGLFAVVALDGVAPVEIELFAPSGQFLGAVGLSSSGDNGLTVQTIDGLGQVLPS